MVSELLQKYRPEKDAQKIVALITTGQFTHNCPIIVERDKSVGLCISPATPILSLS